MVKKKPRKINRKVGNKEEIATTTNKTSQPVKLVKDSLASEFMSISSDLINNNNLPKEVFNEIFHEKDYVPSTKTVNKNACYKSYSCGRKNRKNVDVNNNRRVKNEDIEKLEIPDVIINDDKSIDGEEKFEIPDVINNDDGSIDGERSEKEIIAKESKEKRGVIIDVSSQENMSQTNNENMSQTNNVNMSQTNKECMSQSSIENITQTNNENVFQTNDENMSEANNENMCQTKNNWPSEENMSVQCIKQANYENHYLAQEKFGDQLEDKAVKEYLYENQTIVNNDQIIANESVDQKTDTEECVFDQPTDYKSDNDLQTTEESAKLEDDSETPTENCKNRPKLSEQYHYDIHTETEGECEVNVLNDGEEQCITKLQVCTQSIKQDYSAESIIKDNDKLLTGNYDAEPSPSSLNKSMKHPLDHKWTFWYFCQDSSLTWEKCQRKLISVTTVEDFWCVHNWILSPSNLHTGSDYSLFKEDIYPDWADKANTFGGRWLVNCDRRQLDQSWLEILLALIGDQMGEDGRCINGAVVQVRSKIDRLALWLGGVGSREVGLVGTKLREVLGGTCTDRVWDRAATFKPHKNSI